jgi:DNA-binding transcriptional LysR family regulator
MSEIASFDSLSGMAAFVASVDAGGFAAAGRKLGISASAVGKSVGRLEVRLGVTLLHRTTRSIALTREGERLYESAARILRDVREAEDAIGCARDMPRGQLKVSVPTVVGRRVIVPALPRFIEKYPDLKIDLRLDDLLVDIVAEGYDLVLRLGDLEDSRLMARAVAPHRFVTCAAPSYLEANSVPNDPADLARHRCIRYRFPTTGLIEQWKFKGALVPWDARQGMILNDGEALAAAAVAGLGIVQVPAYQVSEYLAANSLRPVLNEYAADRGSVWLVWPPARAEVPRVRVFAEFITNLLASQA